MHKIRDWLYISDFNTAASASMLKKHGIEAVLLLHRRTPIDVESLYLPVYDAKPVPHNLFKQAEGFIQLQYDKKRPLLSSCGAGVSRSVVFAMLALHKIENLTMRESYLDIVSRHPAAMPDHQHWDSLQAYLDENQDFWEVWQEVVGLD
ncbi:MAG: dual specificity protein phosphatase family protein [Aggregatilineales bacterium]